MGCLYQITVPDGRSYIGITKHSLDTRIAQHLSRARREAGSWLHQAIRAHGEAALSSRILVVASDHAYLCELERAAIAAFGTLYPHGLNSARGGGGVLGSDVHTEIERRKKLSKAHSKRSAKRMASARAAAYWTDERRAERAELTRRKWADPETRARILASRKRPVQRKMKLPAATDAQSRVMTSLWATPEWRESILRTRGEILRRPEERARIAATQKAVMADPEIRIRIALSLNKFRNCTFAKGAEPRLPKHDRGGLLQNTIPALPEKFSCEDAIRLGWMGREFRRALDRGWITIESGDVR